MILFVFINLNIWIFLNDELSFVLLDGKDLGIAYQV